MKKTYHKPYVIKESFQLDAAIADSCSSQNKLPLNYGTFNCTDSGSGYYAYESSCRTGVMKPGGDGNDLICYQGPFGSVSPFLAS